MSFCDIYRETKLVEREQLQYTVDESSESNGMNGTSLILKTLNGKRADGLRIKKTNKPNLEEPYATCLAGQQDVGAPLKDAWTDKKHTYMVMKNYQTNLGDYMRKKHTAAELQAVDHALVSLYERMDAMGDVCHTDLHEDNIVLETQGDGSVEARAIDWGEATLGQGCARESFAKLFSSIPTESFAKLPMLSRMFTNEVAMRTPAKRPADRALEERHTNMPRTRLAF